MADTLFYAHDPRELAASYQRAAFLLANHFVRRFRQWRHLEADIEGEALLALVRAANWFDPTCGIPFRKVVWKVVDRHLRKWAQQRSTRQRELARIPPDLEIPSPPTRPEPETEPTLDSLLPSWLTDRERAILHELASGKSQRQLARERGVSHQAINQTINRIAARMKEEGRL